MNIHWMQELMESATADANALFSKLLKLACAFHGFRMVAVERSAVLFLRRSDTAVQRASTTDDRHSLQAAVQDQIGKL